MNTHSVDSSVLMHKKWRYFLRRYQMGIFHRLSSYAYWQKLMHRRIGTILLLV